MLDVGSGTGFYVGLWRELGVADITGSDLTGVAVERLRYLFPEVRFEQLDISGDRPELGGPYDAISAMDVLFHIVDDEGYARAFRNLATLLTPGGRLVFTENLLHAETQRAEYQTSRSLDEVEGLLRDAGLEVELRRPMFVLMNTPVDSDSAFLRRTWTAVNLLVQRGPRWGSLADPSSIQSTLLLAAGLPKEHRRRSSSVASLAPPPELHEAAPLPHGSRRIS